MTLKVEEPTFYRFYLFDSRWIFTPTEEEKKFILDKFSDDLTIPLNFTQTARGYDETEQKNNKNITQPNGQTNPQTTLLCDTLGIDDPTKLILTLNGRTDTSQNKSFPFIPAVVEIQNSRLNKTLPEPEVKIESPKPKFEKLSLTLPAPKNKFEDLNVSSISETEKDCESDISGLQSSAILSDTDTSAINTDVSISSPQKKGFKRRNQSIYNDVD